VILYEYMHFFRVIPIDKPHPDDVELTFMGDAVAKWDGDTLVIDTIGLKSWPISASNQWHSDALHTLERLHHIDAATSGVARVKKEYRRPALFRSARRPV